MIEWFAQNKDVLKIIYSLILILICIIVVVRTNRLFRLSSHQGIRYFRNAFFFYGIGFFARYILGSNYIEEYFSLSGVILTGVFEFFLIMGGFFLLYSLIWKRIESEKGPYSSLVNGKILMFYLMALIIVILDQIWHQYLLMFLSQIVVFAITIIISYSNYQKNITKGKFLKNYFLAMIFGFIAWVLNFLAGIYFNWHQGILMGVYGLNLILFLLFLIGVVRVTK